MKAFVVTDLGYGDAGKGTVVDALVRKHDAELVVRHNGGAQAAHNVVIRGTRITRGDQGDDHHTFAQFGSGSLIDGVRTYLGPKVLVNPLNMITEAEHLRELGAEDILGRTYIDARAVITTPFHIAGNQIREILRAGGRHGSCGLGIGETMIDQLQGLALRAGDLSDPALMAEKLGLIREHKLQEMQSLLDQLPAAAWTVAEPLFSNRSVSELAETYAEFQGLINIVSGYDLTAHQTIVFEGAQGVLLDEDHGFHPYTTWSHTTTANADQLLDGYPGQVERIGLLRSYMTRHGAGPFVTEDPELGRLLPEAHNGYGRWQQHWRVGHPDLVALRYALQVAGDIDQLAITCLDLTDGLDLGLCTDYMKDGATYDLLPLPEVDLDRQQLITETLLECSPVYAPVSGEQIPEIMERETGLPVTLRSWGPTADDKEFS